MLTFLAHGASGSVATIKPWTDALRDRGFDATPVGLPRGTAERALPVYRGLVERAVERAAGPRTAGSAASVVVGGHSFGGRVASLLAAEQPLAGLVLISYPLHRPGHPDQLRIEHWPRIDCPTVLLSGESDPFARIDLLRAAIQQLPAAQLVTYPRVGHGLSSVMDDALDVIADFLSRLTSAAVPGKGGRRGGAPA